MEQFDTLFFTIFQYYKKRYKTKANDIALFYILLLQASILLLIGAFILLFFEGMNRNVISLPKALTLYLIGIIALIFRNWIYYTGKKRKVLNAKLHKSTKSATANIWILWLIPLACFFMGLFLIQRL